ncbi:MAG: winged helix-turn-helix domain-containing protein [Candidatus Dormibacteraeota bacterium]|nr:winged helix-turn-helix domain-containing protein [Candidatus Dormibacteraeota bacterium]
MAEKDARTSLLAHTDSLLERVELLRLQGVLRVPEQLQYELEAIAPESGDEHRARRPRTLAAAHRYLFDLQIPLLSGEGSRRIRRQAVAPDLSEGGQTVRRFALPARESVANEAVWLDHVRLVVQRARDAARYLGAQAEAARTLGPVLGGSLASLRSAQAESARTIFESLLRQAERATGRTPTSEPAPSLPRTGQLVVADLHIDLERGRVRKSGRTADLTGLERTYLVGLAAHPDRVLSREALMQLVHGDDPKVSLDSRAIDVHLSNLRRKLGRPAYLRTIPGIGFYLSEHQVGVQDRPDSREERRRQRRAYVQEHRAATSPTYQPAPTAPEPNLDLAPK